VTSLSAVFDRAKAENRAALIGYLPAGFPDVPASISLMQTMVESGVDIIEVGLPYSDPLMDGPVIQHAAATALAAGATTDDVLKAVGAVHEAGAAAVVMSYWNPIERYGVGRFAQAMSQVGGQGLITPDLTPEEAGEWQNASAQHDLDRIFLVAPSSTPARISVIVNATSGFVYAASVMGVTGARNSVSGHAHGLVARIRESTQLPICVGLGVSTGAQANEIAAYADGVIVGSAFVRAITQAADFKEATSAVASLSRELATGVRRRNEEPEALR
jgi:tryptophan synthase alpha chain